VSVAEVLLDILIVIVAAKVAAEIAERLGFPAVVAEIVAGVIVGPSVFGLVGDDEVLHVLGEIGVILLLLQVGLEMSPKDLASVGRASSGVAVLGIAVPIALGFGVALAWGHEGDTSLFLGAALCATSVGITARVLSELKALGRIESRTVLGAAVADDVLGLVVLTVVARIVTDGSVSLASVAGIVAVAIGFLVVTTVVGSRAGPALFSLVQRKARSAGTLVALALAFTLAFASLADAARLAPIVGAFVAGLALSGSDQSERIHRELTPVGHLFIPVFFLQIGIDADVGAFGDPSVLAFGGALLVVAVIGKLVAGLGAAGSPGDKWLIGFGMLPRGEVGLIFATIGLETGALDADLYAALLLVVLATTLAAPPLLRWRLARLTGRRDAHPVAAAARPPDGWLRVRGGVVDLAANPPPRLRLHLGLESALAVADARPGPELLQWLGRTDDAPITWDGDATRLLFAVLLRGDARSWRFLEATGLLESALPELSEAVARRRADPVLVDPVHVLRFGLVDALRDLSEKDERAGAEQARLEHPEWLLLAALILDAAGEDAAPVPLARRLVQRLDLGANAEEEIALLVGESSLMRAAASRLDGLEEEAVLAMAVHLRIPERARALYLLGLALGDLEPWDRDQLDELLARVLAVLEDEQLTGLDASNLVEQRRAAAVRLAGGQRWRADRAQHAPRGYLLTQEAGDVARHAGLLEPLPGRDKARVQVLTLGPREWRVEVASRARPGLLSTVAGVIADRELDIVDAVVATWPDGGALESFRVRPAPGTPGGPADPPEAAALEAAIVSGFDRPLSSAPCPDAVVSFDDHGSPWYTRCEVRSPDRRGLLRTIAVALASADTGVHSARVLTQAGEAVDVFELTDAAGEKLDDAAKDAIRLAIRDGVVAKRRRRDALLRRSEGHQVPAALPSSGGSGQETDGS